MSDALTFVICKGCRGQGADLAAAVARACPEVPIIYAPCMSVCADPVTLAAQGHGRASYVFSGVTPEHAEDIAAFARAYEAADKGWIEDARPLGRLRFQLVTRIPAV